MPALGAKHKAAIMARDTRLRKIGEIAIIDDTIIRLDARNIAEAGT
jgi:hypothetical protein